MNQRTPPRHRVDYKPLPKVELHRHLEGTLRLNTLLEIARTHTLDMPNEDIAQFRSFVQVHHGQPLMYDNYLSKFEVLRQFFQSPEIIERITREAIADAAAENIRYMELRFTPVAMSTVRGFGLDEVMDWVIHSTQSAALDYGIKTKLIVSVNRHEDHALAAQVSRLAVKRMEEGIVGLDLAGREADSPAAPFVEAFNEAKRSGLNITIHAGEWAGPANIIQAIEQFSADRIGHGVRVLEDNTATELARQQGVTFEVCITSNYHSGVVPTPKAHPLPEMIAAGLNIAISTDNPSLSQIDLTHEYEIAGEELGLSTTDLKATILAAAHASFLPPVERQTLVASLENELAREV